MADVLIRGMEMPHNCLFCPCSFWDERTLALWCHALSTYDDNLVAENVTAIEAHGGNTSKVKRPDFCPLTELPKHGDLISKDDAMNAILGEPPEAHYPPWYASIVNEIPAIVPSNQEESE